MVTGRTKELASAGAVRGRAWPRLTVMIAAALVGSGSGACGQVATSLNGPPVQVVPYVSEPGVPMIEIVPGQPSGLSGLGQTGVSNGTDPATGGGQTVGGSEALNTLLATPYGASIVSTSQALGVNASALAATCVLESGCQNVKSSAGSTASGPFQMINSTYNSMIEAAAQDNPSLASSFNGKNDPVTEAAAAAELLKVEAVQLQNAGISNPNFLDVRGGFAFGNGNTYAVASASDNQPLGAILTNWSAATWQSNSLTPQTTVGQWRQSVISKVGSAASQPVLVGG